MSAERKPLNHVVVYSGGMDSFTLLHWVKSLKMHDGDRIEALSFNYGQRHRRELDAATRVCLRLGIRHTVIDLSAMRAVMAGSALTDDAVAVPHGHYEAESMKLTVVPGRNTLMLACALSFAEGLDPQYDATIYYGAHAGDHYIYPDCRPEFIAAMTAAVEMASDNRVHLYTPFMMMSKGDILRLGTHIIGIAAENYADTWTCYEGGAHPCGRCGACVERAEAFASCGINDPLLAAPA